MATTRNHRRRSVGDDPALAARLRTGDPAAFEQLFRRHHRRLTRYVAARLAGRDRDAVDDLVQDAFCDAIAQPAQFSDDVLGCLLRLAARACTRHLWDSRRHARAAYTVYEDRTSPAAGSGQPTAPAPTVGRMQFTTALARLAPDQRRAIQLLYLDGQPRPAVAALMGRSIEAVRALQRRALRQLQQQLAADQPAEPTGPASDILGWPAPDQATPPHRMAAAAGGWS
jgi:RNA polymerase sigma-70 factor, ECF subfamily